MSSFSAIADDALGDSDVVDLLDRLRRREVSADELATAARERTQRAQDHLNAVAAWVPADHPAAATGRAGPFSGIPTALKDNEDLAGLPTSQGSAATPRTPAKSDSVMTALLAELGVSLVAKTTMPEFGLTASTETVAFGPTRNPWHLDHSVGGSSGGAAALVAAGALPMAHANDGGGSIRIPAACCGLVGLKPSRGYLPMPERMELLPVKISAQGILTRTVRDTAAFFAACNPVAPDIAPVGVVHGPAHRRLRVAVMTGGIVGQVAPDTVAAVNRAAIALESSGHFVEPVETMLSLRFGQDFLRYWALLAWLISVGGQRLMGPQFQPAALEPFTLGLANFVRTVAPGIPSALRRLRRFPAEYAQALGDYDVVLSPVTNDVAPPLGYLDPTLDFRTHALRLLPFAGFTPVQNVAGTPSISVPMGLSPAGLPLSVMASAHYGGERTLLELAYELEAIAPWPQTPAARAPAAQPPSSPKM